MTPLPTTAHYFSVSSLVSVSACGYDLDDGHHYALRVACRRVDLFREWHPPNPCRHLSTQHGRLARIMMLGRPAGLDEAH